jgi:hypothetical protein
MIPPDYEKVIRRAFLQVLVLCLCAVVPPLFSLTGIFAPEDEALGQWFQRSGAVMTVLAVLAQLKASGIATTMIAGGTFAETWEAYHKYHRFQVLTAWLSLVLVVIGTLIWAYGDLLFPESEEEQNAIVWCEFGVCPGGDAGARKRGHRGVGLQRVDRSVPAEPVRVPCLPQKARSRSAEDDPFGVGFCFPARVCSAM